MNTKTMKKVESIAMELRKKQKSDKDALKNNRFISESGLLNKAYKQAISKKAKKKEAKKVFSFSQFSQEYNRKADKLSLSVTRIEKGKTQAERMTTSVNVKSFIPIFDKIRKINDGLTRRKEAIKSVKSYVLALKTIAPRAHVLRPIIECIFENYKKDYSSLIQKSFQR